LGVGAVQLETVEGPGKKKKVKIYNAGSHPLWGEYVEVKVLNHGKEGLYRVYNLATGNGNHVIEV
jgi:hypothetical protein